MFRLASAQDDDATTMSKEELVSAHHGDFRVFGKLDADKDGAVTLDEWHAFLKRTHDERGLHILPVLGCLL